LILPSPNGENGDHLFPLFHVFSVQTAGVDFNGLPFRDSLNPISNLSRSGVDLPETSGQACSSVWVLRFVSHCTTPGGGGVNHIVDWVELNLAVIFFVFFFFFLVLFLVVA